MRLKNKMYFSKENIQELKQSYEEIEGKCESLFLSFNTYSFQSERAAEFAYHGFIRRMKTLKRCIDNIYRICPPDIDRKLSSEELDDTEINLQAFVFNICGALDNLAWIWAKENNVRNKKNQPLENSQIGFGKKYKCVRGSFPEDLKKYLKTKEHEKWFSYIEDFRHTLAHRISLYVPPYVFNEEEEKKEKELKTLQDNALKDYQFDEYKRLSGEIEILGSFIPWMTHSFEEESKRVVFHAQIIADWNTVVEISELFIKELKKTKSP